MNVISYSLFFDCPHYLYRFYVDGIDYNKRMAELIFKGWTFNVESPTDRPRCESMLWRLKPCWMEGVERVICRDLDSLLTYRDFKSVERWIESGKSAHGMNDNPAHGGLPLMGGMLGFKADVLRNNFATFEDLI